MYIPYYAIWIIREGFDKIQSLDGSLQNFIWSTFLFAKQTIGNYSVDSIIQILGIWKSGTHGKEHPATVPLMKSSR